MTHETLTAPVENRIETEQTPMEKYTLLEMRKRSNISGTHVAEMCNTTYRSLRNWELGIATPNVVYIRDLLNIYGYTFDQLDLTLYYESIEARVKEKRDAKAHIEARLEHQRDDH